MKASYVHGPRDVRIGEMKDAEPGPGEILVNVMAVGICGSDLHTYTLGDVGGIAVSGPLTLGHEASGVIAALGPGVDKEKFRVGQPVAIDPATSCGECEFCQKGDPHLCQRIAFMGLWPYHGAMRERMVHPAKCLVPLPEGISDIAGALLEPLGVALHAVRLANIQVGEDVLVIGAGAIGLLLIRLVRLAGARHVISVDKHPWRMDAASNFGADIVLDASQVDIVEEIVRLTNKRGVDVALEAAWVQDTAAQCMEAARHGGRVIIVGIPAKDEITFRASVPRRKELTIYNSRRMKHTYPAAIALAASRRVNLEALATHRYALDQTSQAFETAANYTDGVVRALVMPQAKP